jgi:NADH:ubiquinone reductase (H+-translocating)
MSRHHILILGGGFAGLYTAMELEKAFKNDPETQITLVNRDNFFLFTPMLHEVAASDLDLTNIVNPIRKLLRKVRFFEGEVEKIDLAQRTVTVSHGFDRHTHDIKYDRLVIGVGSTTNFFNNPMLEKHALTMKTLADAANLRNRLIALLEEADSDCSIGIRRPLLTFVVAGGGFAGVETIASINDFIHDSLRFYPHLNQTDVRVLLVHPGPLILPELSASLGAYAQSKLQERSVEVRVKCKVTGYDGEVVTLSDGEAIQARTLIWTAGTMPSELLQELPCPKDRGRLLVEDTLEVRDWPGVYALGDCALIPDRTTGKYYPPTAQHALREGKVTARNIVASLRGGKKMSFSFMTIGQLAAIGRRTGVAEIFGWKFSGFVAWWMWRSIYLSKLPRLEKKLRVALDWTLDVLFSKDLVQFVSVHGDQAISRPVQESEHSETPKKRTAA